MLSPSRNSIAGFTRLPSRTRKASAAGRVTILLDIFEVDVDRGMSAGAVPVLEHVGMAIDDHSGSLGVDGCRSVGRTDGVRALRRAELLHVILEQALRPRR